MGNELEMKLAPLHGAVLDVDRVLGTARRLFDLDAEIEPRRARIATGYHIDSDGELLHRRSTLRHRSLHRDGEPSMLVATFKAPGPIVAGVRQRVEVEVPLDALPQAGDALPADFAAPLADLELDLTTWPRVFFHARFDRVTLEFEIGAARIELAVDHGEVEALDRRDSFTEVELELLDGDPEELLPASRKLAHELGLRPAWLSKAERGLRLLDLLEAPRLADGASYTEVVEFMVRAEERSGLPCNAAHAALLWDLLPG